MIQRLTKRRRNSSRVTLCCQLLQDDSDRNFQPGTGSSNDTDDAVAEISTSVAVPCTSRHSPPVIGSGVPGQGCQVTRAQHQCSGQMCQVMVSGQGCQVTRAKHQCSGQGCQVRGARSPGRSTSVQVRGARSPGRSTSTMGRGWGRVSGTRHLFVCWLLNVPATGEGISGTVAPVSQNW